jgi:hypothetical protein
VTAGDAAGPGNLPADDVAERRAAARRYLVALALLLGTLATFAASGPGRWGAVVAVVAQGSTLIAVLAAAESSRRLRRWAAAAVAVAVVVTAAAVASGQVVDRWAPVALAAVLAFVGPVAIGAHLLRRSRIDLATVWGALGIYLHLGLFFAFAFAVVDAAEAGPFFAQSTSVRGVDLVYFSFVTLATLGYGDLTPVTDTGRMLAVSETLIGQLYLVGVVALLVGQIGSGNPRRPR